MTSPAETRAGYAAVYTTVLFSYLDKGQGRVFSRDVVTSTPGDEQAFELLVQCGAVIPWGEQWSLSAPERALDVFAVTELSRPVYWSPTDVIAPYQKKGLLIPGSAEQVLAHFDLEVNPVGTPPVTIWHGCGPDSFNTEPGDELLPWISDGLTDSVPLAVCYSDLFRTPGWQAEAFAEYVKRRLFPKDE